MDSITGPIYDATNDIDFKYECTRDWMGFKLGGLVKRCEEGMVIVVGASLVSPVLSTRGLSRGHRRLCHPSLTSCNPSFPHV